MLRVGVPVGSMFYATIVYTRLCHKREVPVSWARITISWTIGRHERYTQPTESAKRTHWNSVFSASSSGQSPL